MNYWIFKHPNGNFVIYEGPNSSPKIGSDMYGRFKFLEEAIEECRRLTYDVNSWEITKVN